MSVKKYQLVFLIFITSAMLMILYHLNDVYIWMVPVRVKYIPAFKYGSMSSTESCILSFLIVNNLSQHLKRVNETNTAYLSFHTKPLTYDNIGKECSSVFYNGQQNETMKELIKSCFYPFKILKNKREKMQETLKLIKRSFEEHKIELVLTGGSFIGSWRYHQMIPYDDDIDFYILSNQKWIAKKVLMSLSENKTNECFFKDSESSNQHWKLGVVCGDSNINSCMIQIDFFFMWKEAGFMKFLEWPGYILVVDYYPLKWRPFETVLFQSPNNFEAYIHRQYSEFDTNVCQFMNHAENSKSCIRPRVDCDLLRFKYPYKVSALYNRVSVEMIVYRMTVTSVFISHQ